MTPAISTIVEIALALLVVGVLLAAGHWLFILYRSLIHRAMTKYHVRREEAAAARAAATGSEREAAEQILTARKAQIKAESELKRLEAERHVAERNAREVSMGLDAELGKVKAELQMASEELARVKDERDNARSQLAHEEAALRDLTLRLDEMENSSTRLQRENNELTHKLGAMGAAGRDADRIRAASGGKH